MKKLLWIIFLVPLILSAKSYKIDMVEGVNNLYIKESIIDSKLDIGYKLESLIYDSNNKCYNVKFQKNIKKINEIIYSKPSENYFECIKDFDLNKLVFPKNIVLKDKEYSYIISNNFNNQQIDIIKLKDGKIMFDRSLNVQNSIYIYDALLAGENNIIIVGKTNENSGGLINNGMFDAFLYVIEKEHGEAKVIKSVGTEHDDSFIKVVKKDDKTGEYYILGKTKESYIYKVKLDGTIISKKRFQNTAYLDIESYKNGIIVAGSKNKYPAIIFYDKNENIVWKYLNTKYEGEFFNIKITNHGIYALGRVKIKKNGKDINKIIVQKINSYGANKNYKLLGLVSNTDKLVVDNAVAVLGEDKTYVLDLNLKKSSLINTLNKVIFKKYYVLYTSNGTIKLNVTDNYSLVFPLALITAIALIYMLIFLDKKKKKANYQKDKYKKESLKKKKTKKSKNKKKK